MEYEILSLFLNVPQYPVVQHLHFQMLYSVESDNIWNVASIH